MKIIVAGASGSVGRRLVPRLAKQNIPLLLVGRSVKKLQDLFPGYECCSYDDLAVEGKGADLLFHLAGRNNNLAGNYEDFKKANVDHACDVLQLAQEADVKRFVYVSTFHSLDPWRKGNYSLSKKNGVKALRKLANPGELLVLYLPAVYGDGFSGRLKFLNLMPRLIAKPIFSFLAALRPTVSITKLSTFIVEEAGELQSDSAMLADEQRNNLTYSCLSRFIDISFALFIVIGFWWLLALIWVAIRIDSQGSGLFRQMRVGRRAEPFECWKFRTMSLGTKQAGTHEVSADAITKVGGVLRRYKLDELPQIWNLLRGDLSLIGPRPCLSVQKKLIEERTRRGVLEVKPGISGLSQVEGIDMSDPEKLSKRDSEYIAMQSLFLDIRLIIATALGKGAGDQIATKRLAD